MFVLAGQPLTSAELVRLGQALGLTASNVKSHLTRLVDEGVLQRRGVARKSTYAPTNRQMRLVSGIEMRLQSHDAPWDRQWIALCLGTASNPTELAPQMWMDGFRPVNARTHVRPNWPDKWASSRANEYAGRNDVILIGKTVRAGERNLASLYDLDGLHAEGCELSMQLDGLRRSLSPEAAFAARIEIGGLVASLLSHDPHLPREIWGRRDGLERVRRAFEKFELEAEPKSRAFLQVVLAKRPNLTEGGIAKVGSL